MWLKKNPCCDWRLKKLWFTKLGQCNKKHTSFSIEQTEFIFDRWLYIASIFTNDSSDSLAKNLGENDHHLLGLVQKKYVFFMNKITLKNWKKIYHIVKINFTIHRLIVKLAFKILKILLPFGRHLEWKI